MKRLEDYVISIPNFPKEGIVFRDVTSILEDPDGLKLSIHELMKLLSDTEYDVIAGLEARGFIFGMPIAYNKSKPFIPVRKKGKLPRETVSKEYALEYGTAEIEIHKDSIFPGQRVVIVDDLLATGGTAKAAAELIESLGGVVVKMVFVMELAGLKGREVLEGYDVESCITYEGK
ncbi:MAG: adenine phosphoribosyltransferase [Eubacteriales bacterium]|nr:adenine phosphoribosyltransferase [Eubacteriales bacterium]